MTSNIETRQDGDKLIVTITGVNNAGHPSSTGKTKVVASTEGNIKVGDRSDGKLLILGLNLYYKP